MNCRQRTKKNKKNSSNYFTYLAKGLNYFYQYFVIFEWNFLRQNRSKASNSKRNNINP